MKVAFIAKGGSQESELADCFGRGKYVLIWDSNSGKMEVLRLRSFWVGSGSGVKIAQDLAARGVDLVVTSAIGQNARAILSEAGIEVKICSGKVEDIRKELE